MCVVLLRPFMYDLHDWAIGVQLHRLDTVKSLTTTGSQLDGWMDDWMDG